MIYLLYHHTKSPCFASIVRVVKDILTVQYQQKVEIVQEPVLSSNDLHLVWWPNITILPKYSIIYNMDPIVPRVAKELLQILTRPENINCHIIGFLEFANSEFNNLFYKQNCLSHIYLPFGISKHQTIPVENISKDVDVLFFGGLNPKRNKILTQIQNWCFAHKYTFACFINTLYNEYERAKIIRSSKIILSIPSNDICKAKGNDLARIAFIIANDGYIIAEKTGDEMLETLLPINWVNNEYEMLEQIEKTLNCWPIVYKNIYKDVQPFYNFDKELDIKIKYLVDKFIEKKK